jgi:hypothetical protein
LYSLDVFLPVVNLRQEENWLPVGWWYFWMPVQIFFGWTLTTFLIAALTGLIKRD